MKVFQISTYDIFGGAARAAYRIHHALRRENIDSMMMVNTALSGDWTVRGPTGKVKKTFSKLRPLARKGLCSLLRTGNPIIHSPNVMSSIWPKRLNISDSDILHLHWVADEMLSVSDIGKLRKPVVWTLHDMWAFCGAEHYTDDFRWRDGYTTDNRPWHEKGFDLNRWTWQRKQKHWRHAMHIVSPSRWLADCARESVLMRDWPITVVPNALDTEIWRPINKDLARELLRLPHDRYLLLFGVMGGRDAPHKGFDLLQRALKFLKGEIFGVELLMFGQMEPRKPLNIDLPVYYTGYLHDDLSLRALYSAADVLVVPSRQEAFCQNASEAHACGTPVVAFDTGGLPDIVNHKKTGYLAKSFDVRDLTNGICWVLKNREQSDLSANARQHAVSHFSYPVVAKQYKEIYRLAMKGS